MLSSSSHIQLHRGWRRPAPPYALGLAAAGTATVLRWMLMSQLEFRSPYVLIYPAVLLVGILAGWGPALVCLGAATAAAIYLFLPPDDSLAFRHRVDAVELGSFLAVSLIIVALANAQRRSWSKRAATSPRMMVSDAESADVRLDGGNENGQIMPGRQAEAQSEISRRQMESAIQDLSIARQALSKQDRELAAMREITEVQRQRFEELFQSKQADQELVEHRVRLEVQVKRRTAELIASHERLRVSERMAAIGTLVAGLGHDMGNLVLPMLCRLDWLAEQALPAQVNQHIEGLRESALHLRQLTSGLGLFASDAQDGSASEASTSIVEWWTQTGPLLQKLLPIHIPLQWEIPDDLPPIALAPHQLTHVARALVTNAGEAITGQGVVRLWARAAADGKSVRLGLTDNGKGMGGDVRRHAFEPFFTTKKRGLSTGLGLTMVHGIIRSVGGSVDIDSKPDRGTTVVLTIPAARTLVRNQSPEAKARIAHVTLKDQRIASYTRTMLESASFDVLSDVSAQAGQEVLWITEPAVQGVDSVKRFLREGSGRRVILVGGPSEEWNEPGVEVVDGSHRAMRQALQKAVVELT